MTEEENVQEEAPAQEQEVNQEKQIEASREDKTPEKPKEDRNWQQARQTLSQQKQQIEELQMRLQEMAKPVHEPKDEFSELDPDDVITVAKARQLAESIAEKKAQKAAREMVQEYAQQQTIHNDEVRCRSKFQDYDYVMENFAVPMIKNDPAFAHKIQMSKNPAETAYKLGKLSDAYEDQIMEKQSSPKAEKILKNSQRPVSSNSVGSPLKAQADQFSNLSKDDIWSMSQKFAKGA